MVRTILFVFAVVTVVAPIMAIAADGVGPSGANGALSPAGAPPPEKIAPNTSTAPGVMAPKATPAPGAIMPNPSATTPPSGSNAPDTVPKNPS
jgi:hypothetical protein